MNLREWDRHYETSTPDMNPHSLLVETLHGVPPGHALDLACGTGRNALYLARLGWEVTAVDGSTRAIKRLKEEAQRRGVAVEAVVADLEANEFPIVPGHWDLIACCLYFQRDLLASIKQGIKPAGQFIGSALLAQEGKKSSPFRVQPGELRSLFEDWEILHLDEKPGTGHATSEIAARKP